MVIHHRAYEFRVVAILCLAWSLVNVEFLGINYLMPFIAPRLHLDNTQIGVLVSAFWFPFALSSYLAGLATDRLGARKRALLVAILLFSACSVLSGLARSFSMLLAARLLMGLLEGPILPLAQSIIALEVPAERRALDMGIVQCVGPGVIAGMLGPLVLVAIALRYGWRAGFSVVLLPGLVCALLLALYLREPPAVTASELDTARDGGKGALGFGRLLAIRNIWLCSLLSIMFVTQSLIVLGYMPLFYVRERHFAPHLMSALMSLWGVASVFFGIAVPAVADRVGRRPTAVVASLLGVVCPLAALYYEGPPTILGMLMFVGWVPVAVSILYMATIPAESVPAHSLSTAIGLTFAIGTLIGGGMGPGVAGWLADKWGLHATLQIAVGVTALMAATSLTLNETLPEAARYKRAGMSKVG